MDDSKDNLYTPNLEFTFRVTHITTSGMITTTIN